MASAAARKAWQGCWALVTGASSGIGAAIAGELAEAGVHLVLTARRQERLEALASQLAAMRGIQTRVIAADLNEEDSPQKLFDATEGAGIPIDLLINNAGFGQYGEFRRANMTAQAEMIHVNCTAVANISRLFLPAMVSRRRGAMMIVSSLAAYQPVPYLATYAATKAFDRMLAEALHQELKRFGVKVNALCPGPTRSEFGIRAGAPEGAMRRQQSAEVVARKGLEALAAGRDSVIPYYAGRLQVFAQRFLPRTVVSSLIERMLRQYIDSPGIVPGRGDG